MKLLVTGGTGLLGRVVVARALAAGHAVVATHCTRAAGDPAATWRMLDVRDLDTVQRTLDAVAPDAVIHTAYAHTGPAMRAVSTTGAANIARAAAAHRARLVHMSTDLVFDGEQNDAYTEDDVPSPLHDYGRAKADAEHAVLAAWPTAVVVRTSILYTRSHDDRQTRAALDLLEGRASGGLFVDEFRSPTYADDLAAALLELTESSYAGVLHVAGPDVLSRHALGVALLTAAGYEASALPSARSAEQAVRRPRRCVLRSVRKGAIATRIRGVHEVLATEQRR